MRMGIALVLLMLMVSLAACGGEADLEAGFETQLARSGSCSGFLYAAAADGSLILVFKTTIPAATIAGASGEQVFDFVQSDTDAILYVETGTGLETGFCGDATGNTERRYHAVAGKATYGVTETATDVYSVTLALRDFTLREELGTREVTMPSFDIGTTPLQ